MDLVSKLVPVTENLKYTARFIFEKMDLHDGALNFQHKRRVSKIVCTFRPALQQRHRIAVARDRLANGRLHLLNCRDSHLYTTT